MSTETVTAPATARGGDWAVLLRYGASALPYITLLVAAYSVFCVTTDDPYITYRYAANVWAGRGIVYNPGERVEGFSSPLHLLLMVLLLKIFPAADILFKAKLLGLAFGAGMLHLTRRLARAAGLGDGEAWLAQMLTALNINVAVGAVNGLETTLYACLILLTLTAFLRERDQKRGYISGFWAFLALTARPDFGAIFALLLLIRAISARRAGQPLRETILWALAFLVPALILEAARVLYYGQLVPNTYFAKQVLLTVGLHDGFAYLLHPLFPVPITWPARLRWAELRGQEAAIFSMLIFWGLALLGAVRVCRTRAGVVIGAAALALIAFVLRFGGDWMPGWRFLVPAVPLLAVLQCYGLRAFSASRKPARFAAPALGLALWVLFAVLVPHDPWSLARFSTQGADMMRADYALARKWVACSDYLKATMLPGSVVAYSEMGYAGYENPDLRLIDVRGLTDRQIARLPARDKGPWGVWDKDWYRPGDPLYAILQQRQPDMILDFAPIGQMPPYALGRYYFARYVGDPHDPPQVIFPAMAYRPVEDRNE